jgi:hypothetical protein
VLLALVAGAVWLYRRWKRRRALKPAPAVAPRLVAADEAALARLRGLEATVASLAQGDPDREAARTFAFTFSEILREYLAARFGIDALEATTAELMERVAPLPLGSDRLAWLRAVSEELDAVKFAAGTITPDDATRLIADARAFVHATSVPAPATTTAVDGAQGADAAPAPDTGRTP